jgi:hypothetical protein
LRWTTQEAVRQAEKLANELRGYENGGISGPPETPDNDYNGIDAPY